eukprot:Em0006g136a
MYSHLLFSFPPNLPSLPWSCWERDSNQSICGPADSDLDPSHYTGGVPTSYNVTINDSSNPVVIAANGSPVYTHTFTGLVSDTLYTVSVVAINCAGSSNGTKGTGSCMSPTGAYVDERACSVCVQLLY